jgi:hypothetical protein
MNNYTRILILLFAIMFFWVYSVPAFASTMWCQTSSAGVTTCYKDGQIIVIQTGVV